jgi:hypothetical protein
MNLMMFLGNDLLEAVPLDKDSIPIPGYLGNLKRSLKEKYRQILNQCPEPPEFLVIGPSTAKRSFNHS